MKYRQLGNSGLEVSEIGFGTWGFGGDSYGPITEQTCENALRVAYERGVTFFDTSDFYGGGRSEEILGRALAKVRSKIVIATKVGMLPGAGRVTSHDFSRQHIVSSVEDSLRRLHTDYIDLYQLHSPHADLLQNPGDVLETMTKLRKDGKIRALGVSVRGPGDALLVLEKSGIQAIQVNFNLIDQRAVDNGLFDRAAEKGVGIIARTPLCFGFLAGRMTGEENFSPDDHRSGWPREQLRLWAKAPAVFSRVNEGTKRSITDLALKFCVSFECVSTVIPGMLSDEEVLANTKVCDIPPLTQAELKTIRDVYKANVFFRKNTRE